MSAAAKPKRRNSEKRKEKSRDAARCRRNMETGIFYELAHELPISYSLLSQLDKASVIRLSITHLKLRQLLVNEAATNDEESVDKLLPADIVQRLDQQYYKSLDGFLIVVARQGDIVYISENVEKYLGLTQVDMLGHNVVDFVHPCDHDELYDLISGKLPSTGGLSSNDDAAASSRQRALFVRMKCTLTSKGRNINIKSAAFKVIHFCGKLMLSNNSDSSNKLDPSCTVLVGRPVPGLGSLELALDRHSFVTKHSLDLRFVYCDDELLDLLGYNEDDLVGNSVFKYHHAFDADILDKAYKTLFVKGQSMTGLYRFLAKNGGFVWMETRAVVIGDSQLDRARSVVCINHVISDIECDNVILADIQAPQLTTTTTTTTTRDVKSKPLAVINTNITTTTAAIKKRTNKSRHAPSDSLFTTSNNRNCVIVVEEDPAEVIVCDDEEDDDDTESSCSTGMQFVTEKLLSMKGLTLSFLREDKSPMLSAVNHNEFQRDKHVDDCDNGIRTTMTTIDSSLDNILDDLNCGMDMRAPYIPMDDMIFAVSSPVLSSTSSPIDLTVCTANTLDVDVMNDLFSCARPLINTAVVASANKKLEHGSVASSCQSVANVPALSGSVASSCQSVASSVASVPALSGSRPTSKRSLSDHVTLSPSKLLRTNQEPAELAAIVETKNQPTTAVESRNQPTTTTVSQPIVISNCVTGSSVLLNLLTTGVDSNWGYRLRDSADGQSTELDGSCIPSNLALTSLLRHLLTPSSPDNSPGSAGVNCVSGSELLFHVAPLPSGTK